MGQVGEQMYSVVLNRVCSFSEKTNLGLSSNIKVWDSKQEGKETNRPQFYGQWKSRGKLRKTKVNFATF